MWIYGYVDYTDKFDQNHRGGYERVYDHTLHSNKFKFMEQSGYNYDDDRPRINHKND